MRGSCSCCYDHCLQSLSLVSLSFGIANFELYRIQEGHLFQVRFSARCNDVDLCLSHLTLRRAKLGLTIGRAKRTGNRFVRGLMHWRRFSSSRSVFQYGTCIFGPCSMSTRDVSRAIYCLKLPKHKFRALRSDLINLVNKGMCIELTKACKVTIMTKCRRRLSTMVYRSLGRFCHIPVQGARSTGVLTPVSTFFVTRDTTSYKSDIYIIYGLGNVGRAPFSSSRGRARLEHRQLLFLSDEDVMRVIVEKLRVGCWVEKGLLSMIQPLKLVFGIECEMTFCVCQQSDCWKEIRAVRPEHHQASCTTTCSQSITLVGLKSYIVESGTIYVAFRLLTKRTATKNVANATICFRWGRFR